MERKKLIKLVTAAQSGDHKAVDTLFNAYYNDVYYFALKTVKDEDAACEITQDTFVSLLKSFGDLKEPAAFITWMKQIAYNHCARFFQKRKDVLVDEDEDGNTVFDSVLEERAEFVPDEALDQDDFRKTIMGMLDELSPEQRSATMLYYYSEMSVRQIAQIQSVSEGTVKSRLNYARKAIKKSVEDYEKKNDVRLHSVALLPLLFWLFAGAKEEMPAGAVPVLLDGVAAETGVVMTAGNGSAAGGAVLLAKLMGLPAILKVTAVVATAALVVACVSAAIPKEEPSTEPTVPTQAEQTVPTLTVTEPTATEPAVTEPSVSEPPVTEPQHTHAYMVEIKDATCTTDGIKTYTCECGDGYTEKVSAIGHDYSATVARFPSCTSEGKRHYQCGNCGDSYDEVIEPEEHNWEHSVGYYRKRLTCKGCGWSCVEYEKGWEYDSYTYDIYTHYWYKHWSEYTQAESHEYTEDIVWVADEKGLDRWICTECGSEKDVPPVVVPPVTEPEATVYYVPEGCTYIMADGTELQPGEAMPQTCSDGDRLVTKSYTYVYGYEYNGLGCFEDTDIVGWSMGANDWELEEYPALLAEINGEPLVSLKYAFYRCETMDVTLVIPDTVMNLRYAFFGCNFKVAPEIPYGVTDLSYTFSNCQRLQAAPIIPGSVKIMRYTFAGNWSMGTASEIPDGVTDMTATFLRCESLDVAPAIPNSVTTINRAFRGCYSLTQAPVLGNGILDMSGAFEDCWELKSAPVIPKSVTNMEKAFSYCAMLTGEVAINSELLSGYEGCFTGTVNPIVLTGSCDKLEELAATAENGNVTVA